MADSQLQIFKTAAMDKPVYCEAAKIAPTKAQYVVYFQDGTRTSLCRLHTARLLENNSSNVRTIVPIEAA